MDYVVFKGTKYEVYDDELYLSRLEIENILDIEGLDKQINLKALYLNENEITEIKGLESLINLEKLDLNSNRIVEINGLSNLNNLKKLILFKNQITEIKGIGNLTKLKSLSLGENKIDAITNLKSLKNLKKLDLHGNNLREINNLELLTQLKKLYLDYNKIEKIEDLETLINLELISFSRNKIKEINSLDKNIKLKHLNLSYNLITEVKEKSLENLTNLQELYLYKNQITEIKGLEKLENLRTLHLYLNNITKIKGLATLKNLEQLLLFKNQIVKIEGLEKLENLEDLQLSTNKISKIEGLHNLSKLRILELSGNIIVEIEGLDNLNKLEYLGLQENFIKEIKNLDSLVNLKSLDLINNQIEELKGLESLTELQNLKLNGNFLKGFDAFQVNSGSSPKEIAEYCKNKRIKLKVVEYLDIYDETKSFDENVEDFKKILSEINISNFINIGTNLEDKNIAIMQNTLFYNQKPEEILLNERDKTLTKLNMNLIQIHSLKGVEPKKKDKVGHFLFFIRQFWDEAELSHNVLIYNQNKTWINTKIDEMLSLSLLNKPKLVIFPENSVPYSKIDTLKEISKKHSITIVCGLEHKKINSEYINKALIIDNGKDGVQIKQTPVVIKQKDGNHLRENIRCEIFPQIKIFKTSIGRLAIFICKDFLRLCDKIPEWAKMNKVDLIIIPSLTSKILPFHTKALNLLNYSSYKKLKLLFASIGEYGGSEFFSIKHIKRIEESFRKNIRDNVGEVIVSRELIIFGKNITYKDGYVHIVCEDCGSKYSVLTNGAHFLPEDALDLEKMKWEFYLQCASCGNKNYRY